MKRNGIVRTLTLGVLFILLAAFCAYAQMPAVNKHPMELTEKPICSQCHPDKWGEMSHTPGWDRTHQFAAARNAQVCAVCHRESFCADCHPTKEELKPSEKFGSSPERSMPHRGDYLSQHKIDGRINPAACFKCHGRNNNARCKTCHK